WLADGRSTLDLFGRGFVLMTDAAGGASGDLQALLDAALLAGVPLRIEARDDPAVRLAYQKRFVLVRPDGHVAWRGDVLPTDATALLATVTGR
ncbi:MAG: 2-polyprenyl-6-methoxyphenol hydroxylase, partial [Rhizobacter sp.]|nr:2-polyprenyl-6-methoxyphenol hydroxylase [Rhizobacter sp.]